MSNIYSINITQKDLVIMYVALLRIKNDAELSLTDILFDFNMTEKEFNKLMINMEKRIKKISGSKNNEKYIENNSETIN